MPESDENQRTKSDSTTSSSGSQYIDLATLALEAINTKLLCLLKVGEQQYMESLADGKLFCRHMDHYKNPKFKDAAFFDEHEGLESVLQSDEVALEFKDSRGNKVTLNKENGLTNSIVVAANLSLPTFCLHAMHTGDWTHREFTDAEIAVFKSYIQIPDEMSKFKNYVCIITNFNEFLARLGTALDQIEAGARHGFVRYVDLAKVHGRVPRQMLGFIKQQRHEPEREYRFIFSSKTRLPDPFTLDLGSLRDITKLMPLDEFMNSWTVDFDPE